MLVRYTYYGDANLDGKVDGGDYSRIDNGYLQQLTGWYNGDFNYDNAIDGSDYTLIDNAFNTQGAKSQAQRSAISSDPAMVVNGADKASTSNPKSTKHVNAAAVSRGHLSDSLTNHPLLRRR